MKFLCSLSSNMTSKTALHSWILWMVVWSVNSLFLFSSFTIKKINTGIRYFIELLVNEKKMLGWEKGSEDSSVTWSAIGFILSLYTYKLLVLQWFFCFFFFLESNFDTVYSLFCNIILIYIYNTYPLWNYSFSIYWNVTMPWKVIIIWTMCIFEKEIRICLIAFILEKVVIFTFTS